MSRASVRRAAVVCAMTLAAATGCAANGDGSPKDVSPPAVGACRALEPADVSRSSNESATVECTEDHTAETYAVGELPEAVRGADYDSADLATFAYKECQAAFESHLGADESLAMRTVLDWAWFRPSKEAWDGGARWYRCDLVGGNEQSETLVALPATTRDLLQGKPDDQWLACASGDSIAEGTRLPCSEPHNWRAVTTIVLGKEGDPYPGDRVSEVRTRDYCSDSVGAWLNYPVTYDFGYTWFHEAEWDAGNRRSVCWARTQR